MGEKPAHQYLNSPEQPEAAAGSALKAENPL